MIARPVPLLWTLCHQVNPASSSKNLESNIKKCSFLLFFSVNYALYTIGASGLRERQLQEEAASEIRFSSLDPSRFCDRAVSDNEKVLLLTDKWVPPPGFEYPTTEGQKYNVLWEQQYSWLRYSVSHDAAFSCFCLLFGKKVCGKGVNSSITFQIVGY